MVLPFTILAMNFSFSRRALIALSAGAASVVALGGTAAAYHTYYADHVVPGVTVMGQPVSATTVDELRSELSSLVDKAALTLTVEDEKRVVPLADLGVSVDIDAALHQAATPSQSFRARMMTPLRGHDITLSHSIDDAKLEAFARGLIPEQDTHMRNASVSVDEQSGTFTVSEAHPGKTVDIEALRTVVESSATTLQPTEASVTITEEQPVVSTDEAKSFADAANRLVSTEISLTDDIDTFTASAAQKATWVKIPAAGEKLDSPVIDNAKLAEWVKTTAEKTNVEPAPGVNNVNSQGKVVSVHEPGTTGWKANNVEAVTKDVEKAFRDSTNFAGSFTYDQTKPEMTTRLIADGASTHIYAAAPGEKWIDIDLSANTVSGYEGATIVYGPMPMVPGAPETPTVTGKFRVWLQNASQTMRGRNADGTKYETPNVPWATYFHGDYAIHGAPWRSSFGWSGPGGSHGCVNMPVDSAKWFYDFATIGTVVVSHY